MREEETASGAQVIEEEQLLLLANLAVIAFGSLGQESLVVCQLLLVGEGDTINALKRVVGWVSEEV